MCLLTSPLIATWVTLCVAMIDADLLLMTSLCFPTTLVSQLRTRVRDLRVGARIVCMQLDFDDFDEDEAGEDAEGAGGGEVGEGSGKAEAEASRAPRTQCGSF